MSAHRYWRIRVTANQSGGIPTRIAEVEFRPVVGGTDLTGFGSAFTSGGGQNPASAFDDNPATYWDTGNSFSGNLPNFVAYNFGAGNTPTVVEFTIRASTLGPSDDPPKDFTLDYSDNGSTWTTAATFTNEIGWSSGEQRTYLSGLAPAISIGKSSLGLNHQLIESGSTVLSLLHEAAQTGVSVLNIKHRPRIENQLASLQVNHVPAQFGVTSLTINHDLIPVTGVAGVRIRHWVIATGKSSLLVDHVLTAPSGKSNLIIKHDAASIGKSQLNVIHRPQTATTGDQWQLLVALDGTDITQKLNGSVRVEANKGAARLADFVIRPEPGVIDTQAFVKKSVAIDYITLSGGVIQTWHRRFTGIVDDATFDPQTRLISFSCTDNLQQSLEAVDFDLIDQIIGGEYSPILFAETDDGWEYAQQRLQSQPVSYDKDSAGQPRKWEWAAKSSPDFTLSTPDIFHEPPIAITQNTSRDVINEVSISFTHRYSRLWQREIKAVWKYAPSFKGYLLRSSELPNREMFLSSIDRSWWIKSLSFDKLPPSGRYSTGNGITNWVISEALRDQLIIGAIAVLAKRWLQDLQEDYAITVRCPVSIDRFGVAPAVNRYSYQVKADELFERQESSSPALDSENQLTTSSYQAPPLGADQVGSDFYLDDDDRPEVDQAIKTAIAIAKTQILASHHRNEVTAHTLLNPFIDIGNTVRVNTPAIDATGTVGMLVEDYNIDSGAAHSTIAINVYSPNVTDQTDSGSDLPARPDTDPIEASPDITLGTHIGGSDVTTPLDAGWRGFLGNYGGPLTFNGVRYPHEFRMETPAIEDQLRLQQTASREFEYLVAIPEENLTITA